MMVLCSIYLKKNAITIGVEPTNACLSAKKNHHIYNDFFSEKIAKKIKSKFRKIDFIIFTNVFAHINNLEKLLNNLRILTTANTRIVIENHYLGAVLNKKQFDTFYHEHPRTYSLNSFYKIAKLLDMYVDQFEFPKRYGGNIRVIFSKESPKIYYQKKIKKNNFQRKSFYEKLLGLKKYIAKWKVRTKKK